ncbi:glucose/arabinose dehydrogenase/cytochrome c553 [Novosphingobium sp. SG751A]|uniref:c-type cytochrome n=1 Tax=Novosphingobium sp. SG751A TaxID=2587000 RepID=UPI001556408B|nr:c-type cytochrome [Novosphingobium sp. SG751A]NOW47721.1 glucose/arabinose dehydrogenase/cytochrome c553 [Novosphingobium sp. SG751A]
MRLAFRAALLAAPLLLGSAYALTAAGKAPGAGCAKDNGGLSLPPGFCATVFADKLGHTRHLAVAGDGTVYVNSWSGRYFRNAPPAPGGGFVIALRDSNGDGVADKVARFGTSEDKGGHGGTGIALWHGALFVEEHDTIVRYPIRPGALAPVGAGSTVLSELPLSGDHPMHPFAIQADGTLLVNSGSASNACESPNRQPGAKGLAPCTEALTRAGIWAYRADKTGQVFSPEARWATGIRNTGGITFDSAGRIFATQHGRDQLGQNWSQYYTEQQGVELPAEILFSPHKGADFGWPTCYFDGFENRHKLAPEYGGDGKAQGACAGKDMPVAAFPAHWAPNDVAIYTGRAFPAAYQQGAFIAFHGSWNRAPAPQDGYLVAFQPLREGKASGKWIRFADGFAGGFKEPGRAQHRPAGLAVGPDGALYIADDVRGRIWRITYRGAANAPLTPARKVEPKAAQASATGRSLPAGITAQQITQGRAIYLGQAKGGTCVGCHGSDGRGSMAGGSLVGPEFLWSDGSPEGLAATIAKGVDKPKKASGAMPALGGAALSPADVKAVAAYVWTLAHP